MSQLTFISVRQIAQRHGVHKSTIWRRLQMDPTFPRPVGLSIGCTRWRLSELEAWEAAKAQK